MYQVDNQSRIPVYEQIVEQVEKYILTGIITPGDQMPSVRSMSMQLHVNPNTVQKAYAELDKRELTSSTAGVGTFINEDALKSLKKQKKENIAQLKPQVWELRLCGVEKRDVIDIVESVYSEPDMEIRKGKGVEQ